MSIQTGSLTAAEHDFYLTVSGMAVNTPVNEMKARVFSSAGFGGAGKPLTQMEREFLQNFANSSKTKEGDLWIEVVASLGLTPTTNLTENKRLFYTSTEAQLQTAIRALNPVAYYPLDEASGADAINRAPSTLGTLNGTTTGATVGQAGQVGRAYSFDGTGDDVTINVSVVPTTAFSIGFLVYRNGDADVNDRIIDWQDSGPEDGFTFNMSTASNLQFAIRNGATSEAAINYTTPNQTWFFVIVTYEVNSAKLFVNGTQQGSEDTSVTMTAAAANFVVGKRAVSATNYFNGKLQHLFIYNKVLSTDEITKLARIAGLA